MIAVVTGGRHLVVTAGLAWSFREALCRRESITVLRHGGCTGADEWVARECATPARWLGWLGRHLNVEAWPYPPGTGPFGGPMRNRAMLLGGYTPPGWPPGRPKPGADVLLAFPGGRGTANCVKIATEFGIPVVYLERGPW